MEKRDYQKEFIQIFKRLSYRYSQWQIWNDFLYLSAVAMANVVPVKEREEREKQYVSLINRYAKEEQELLTQLYAFVVLALEENPEQDFLGSLYHSLELNQHQKGQFFTPYHICQFMAEIQFAGKDMEEFQKKRYIRVSDPACGAGAMLVAFANASRKNGINYQEKVLFVAQDIDRTAGMMCYVQLSLLGCSTIVIVGDSLAHPGFHPENDVWYTPFYYLNQWRFREEEAEDINVIFPKEQQAVIEQLDAFRSE